MAQELLLSRPPGGQRPVTSQRFAIHASRSSTAYKTTARHCVRQLRCMDSISSINAPDVRVLCLFPAQWHVWRRCTPMLWPHTDPQEDFLHVSKSTQELCDGSDWQDRSKEHARAVVLRHRRSSEAVRAYQPSTLSLFHYAPRSHPRKLRLWLVSRLSSSQ